MLEQILSKLSGAAPPAPPGPAAAGQAAAGGPVDVAEEVNRELARRDQAAAAEQEKTTLAQRLARLEEKVPIPPQRKIERLMWGARGENDG
jgi:hypothetical protein